MASHGAPWVLLSSVSMPLGSTHWTGEEPLGLELLWKILWNYFLSNNAVLSPWAAKERPWIKRYWNSQCAKALTCTGFTQNTVWSAPGQKPADAEKDGWHADRNHPRPAVLLTTGKDLSTKKSTCSHTRHTEIAKCYRLRNSVLISRDTKDVKNTGPFCSVGLSICVCLCV